MNQKSLDKKKYETNIKIKCDRCGYSKISHTGSVGSDGDSGLFGHHRCSDGELGMFRDIKYEKKTKSSEGKGIKLQETTITKTYSDGKRTYIHTKTTRKPQKYCFSGSEPVSMFTGGGYIDLAPKGTFITRWVKRLWNNKKLKKLLKL